MGTSHCRLEHCSSSLEKLAARKNLARKMLDSKLARKNQARKLLDLKLTKSKQFETSIAFPSCSILVMGPSQNFHCSSISSQNFSSRVEFRAKNFRALFEPSQIRAANFSSELEQCSSQQNFLSTFCWSISFHVSKNIISSDI